MTRRKTPRRRVLVTGATGNQGGAVARALLASGHKVLAMTRKPGSPQARDLSRQGASVVEADFGEPATLRAAARGLDSIFLMGTSFEAGPDRERRDGLAALEAAKDAGVPFVLYTSVANADRGTGIPHFESKHAVEKALAASGLAHAIVAPVYFMENALSPWTLPDLRRGQWKYPAPPGGLQALIAVRDIGAVSSRILDDPATFDGQRIDIAGDAIPPDAAAWVLSGATGTSIRATPPTRDEIQAMGPDFAKMFSWFAQTGYDVDVPGLRRRFPDIGWTSLQRWVDRQPWQSLLGHTGREAEAAAITL